MPPVTFQQVKECIKTHNLGELPALLDRLKNFLQDDWYFCIQTVLDWSSGDKEEALHLLLNWGHDMEKWQQLLFKATHDVGEDERFQKRWMTLKEDSGKDGPDTENAKATDREGQATATEAQDPEAKATNQPSVRDHSKSGIGKPDVRDVKRSDVENQAPVLLMSKSMWTECRAYVIAKLLFEEHPDLSTYISKISGRTIYHDAAKNNASAILVLAADVAKQDRKDIKIAINANDNQNKTPLAWAIFENHPVVVRTLFHIVPEVEVTPKIFRQAITLPQYSIARVLACYRPDLIDVDQIHKAIDGIESNRPDDIGFMIWECLFNQLVELKRAKKDPKQALSSFLESSNLLHYAVKKQRLRVVERLVRDYPDLTHQFQRDEDGQMRSVLWYNRNKEGTERTETQNKIRELIATEVIKSLRSAAEIRRIIGDDGKRKELALDLSPGNISPQALSRFLQRIRYDMGYSHTKLRARSIFADLEFEPTLRYVHIPILDGVNGTNSFPGQPGCPDDALIIFQWLKKEKGVTKIIRVHVADSQYRPHSEEIVISALSGLDVKVLDWMRTDLSIDAILEATPDVEELHLYSSGNWCSLSHWVSSDGVGRLEKLKDLQITLLLDNITSSQAKTYHDKLQDKLTELKRTYGWHHEVFKTSWARKSEKPIDDKRGKVQQQTPLEAIKLNHFMDAYRHLQQEAQRHPELVAGPSTKVRVALIDTGVDQTLLDDTFHGTEGASFVSDGESESPWWFARELHGTYMAHIIHAIDPYCVLRIASVGDARRDILAERVARAIRWAISEDVDIICMCFCFDKKDDPLNQAIQEAAAKDIVMLASTSDKGYNATEAWPAKCDEVLGIASCNPDGTRAQYSTASDEEVAFAFQGEQIVVNFEDSVDGLNQVDGGCSVATAMATGVASLILASRRLVLMPNRSRDASAGQAGPFSRHRREFVKDIMAAMMDGTTKTKYSKPWTVLHTAGTEAHHVREELADRFTNLTSVRPSQPPWRWSY